MIKSDFDKLPNFSYQEMYLHYRNKGFSLLASSDHVSKVKLSFMIKLQKFRTLINRPIHFNCLTEGRHVKNSAHYSGIAADIRISGRGAINWNKMLQFAIDARFNGIGWYPCWNTPGLHLDDRKGDFKCWYRDSEGKYKGLI